jgi:hypothetical protein
VLRTGNSVRYTPNADFVVIRSPTQGPSPSRSRRRTTRPSRSTTLTTDEDTPHTQSVVGNDTDVDGGETLAVASVTQDAKGAGTFSNGNIMYTPNPKANGADSFT